jgi:hypothetical protein
MKKNPQSHIEATTASSSSARSVGSSEALSLADLENIRDKKDYDSVVQDLRAPQGKTRTFNALDLDKAIAQLPAVGISLSDSLKKSKSAEQVQLLKSREPDVLRSKFRGEHIYHPPYERGADFADASKVKVSVTSFKLLPGVDGGHCQSSGEEKNNDKKNFHSHSRRLPTSSGDDSSFRAFVSLLEGQTQVGLCHLRANYLQLKASLLGKDSGSAAEWDTLPNLDWKKGCLHYRYIVQREIRFYYGEDGAISNSHRVRDREAAAASMASSAAISKQWECLRVYMHPLISIGVLLIKNNASTDIDAKSLNILFSELSDNSSALLYSVVQVNEGDLWDFLTRNPHGKQVVVHSRCHQILRSPFSSIEEGMPMQCSPDRLMNRLGSLLVLVMEHWLHKASPASLALTTPLDLVRTGDLMSSLTSDHDSVSFMKYSHMGRLRKELGDYCLCMGSSDDALVHYAIALDVTKECEDILWHASALEGTCAVDTSALFAKAVAEESIPMKKMEQLWLSIRQACEQAQGLYKSLPTLRNSLLLKVARFGSKLLLHSSSWSYFNLMTRIHIEKYIEEVVDSLPYLRLVSGKSDSAFCLMDIADIYNNVSQKKRKAAQYMMLAASQLSDHNKRLALHLNVCAGHIYGLDNDISSHNFLWREKGMLELWKSNVHLKQKQQQKEEGTVWCKWPRIIQTVQFGVVTNALSQGNYLLAARSAFYFLVLYSSPGDRMHFELDKKTWKWIFRCINEVKLSSKVDFNNLYPTNAHDSSADIYVEKKHTLALFTRLDLVMDGNVRATKQPAQESERSAKSVFLYNPFDQKRTEGSGETSYAITSGQTIQVQIQVLNPFPLGLLVSCWLCVEKVEEESKLLILTLTHSMKVKAEGRAEGLLGFIPHGQGELKITGCMFQLGNMFSWYQPCASPTTLMCVQVEDGPPAKQSKIGEEVAENEEEASEVQPHKVLQIQRGLPGIETPLIRLRYNLKLVNGGEGGGSNVKGVLKTFSLSLHFRNLSSGRTPPGGVWFTFSARPQSSGHTSICGVSPFDSFLDSGGCVCHHLLVIVCNQLGHVGSSGMLGVTLALSYDTKQGKVEMDWEL